MTRGALLFAFNNKNTDYYKIAEFAARRIDHFLRLPVTLITDKESYDNSKNESDYQWDNVIFVEANAGNTRNNDDWFNKERYRSYELSPYDETLLLDSDYVVNTDQLNRLFDIYKGFMCHNNMYLLMYQNVPNEKISYNGLDMLWATVICFDKSEKTRQIFECWRMVQDNYDHYANIHGFIREIYRNDIALTLALRIVNGHSVDTKEYIPWKLVHVGTNTVVYKSNEDFYDTEYTILFDNYSKPRVKKEYMIMRDYDFHVIDKNNMKELIKCHR